MSQSQSFCVWSQHKLESQSPQSVGNRVDPLTLTLIYVQRRAAAQTAVELLLDVTLQRQLEKSFIDLSQERKSSCASSS